MRTVFDGMPSSITSQNVIEQGIDNARMYPSTANDPADFSAIVPDVSRDTTNTVAMEEVNQLSLVDPPEGFAQEFMDQGQRDSFNLNQNQQGIDIADSDVYEHHLWNASDSSSDLYRLSQLFASGSRPSDADPLNCRLLTPSSYLSSQDMNSSEIVSKLLSEDVIMPRMIQDPPQDHFLHQSRDAVILQGSLPVASASSSTAATFSLANSSNATNQSGSPSQSHQASTYNIPPPSVQLKPPQKPRVKTKFYVAVPKLPPGVTKDDYSCKPIRLPRQSRRSASNTINLGDKAGYTKRKRYEKSGSSIESHVPTALRLDGLKPFSKIVAVPVPAPAAPSQSLLSNVDIANCYEEYVCPPPLLVIDRNMLGSRLPIPVSATLLATRHLRQFCNRSRQTPFSRTADGPLRPGSADRFTDNCEENPVFSDSFASVTNHKTLSHYTHEDSTFPATPSFAPQDNYSPQQSTSSDPLWATFHEPLSQPADDSRANCGDGAAFGDLSYDQHWISSVARFNDPSSTVADGTVDPSLLGGFQQSSSPSPSRHVSPSCSIKSLERQRHSRATSTHGNSTLHSSQRHDPVFDPDQEKLHDNDNHIRRHSRKQRQGHGGGGEGKLQSSKQLSDMSDSASETAVRKRSTGSRKRESAAAKHPSSLLPAERKADYCHQCRNASLFEKMVCTRMLDFGIFCGKKYCVACILKRYADIEFDPYATQFVCPSCTNTCNCTACCAKRKEPYISTRHVKIDKGTLELIGSGVGPRTLPSASEEFVRMSKGTNSSALTSGSKVDLVGSKTGANTLREKKPRAGQKHDRADSTTVAADPQISKLIESYGGTSGTYWGTIFSVTGDRLGAGFVGESGAEIVLKSPQKARKRKRRVYVGKLQEWWGFEGSGEELEPVDPKVSSVGKGKGKARVQNQWEYVGDRSVLFRYKERSHPSSSSTRANDDTRLDMVPFDPADYSEADAEGEDDDEQEPSHWIIIDSYSPVRPGTESMKGMSQEQLHIAMQRAINAMQAG